MLNLFEFLFYMGFAAPFIAAAFWILYLLNRFFIKNQSIASRWLLRFSILFSVVGTYAWFSVNYAGAKARNKLSQLTIINKSADEIQSVVVDVTYLTKTAEKIMPGETQILTYRINENGTIIAKVSINGKENKSNSLEVTQGKKFEHELIVYSIDDLKLIEKREETY